MARAKTTRDEWPLVVFTVFAQAAAGISVVSAAIPQHHRYGRAWAISVSLLAIGALTALLHLGRAGRARFALANLKSSWLSRELLLAGLFGAFLALDRPYASALLGLVLVGAIAKIYMIRTVPPWNTWLTPAAFYLTALILGLAIVAALRGHKVKESGLAAAAAGLAGLQFAVALTHFLRFGRPELRGPLAARVALLVTGAVMLTVVPEWAVLSCCVLLMASELVGRHLFYATHRRVGL